MSDPKSSKKRQSSHTNPDTGTQPVLGMDALTELALNLHWSWNHKADEIWGALDSYLWKTTQNPWVILQTVSQDKINALLATPKFQQRLAGMLRHKLVAHPRMHGSRRSTPARRSPRRLTSAWSSC